MTRPCLALLLGALTLGALACSDAETPDAYFSGGAPDGGVSADGGPPRGGRDQLCDELRCDSSDLVCVDPNNNIDGNEVCRLLCDRDDPGDPCGQGSTCVRLQDDNLAACMPASGLDGPCETGFCEEGLRCVEVGGQDVCKTACDPNAPPDAGPQCADGEECRALNDNSGRGACIES